MRAIRQLSSLSFEDKKDACLWYTDHERWLILAHRLAFRF